MRFDKALLFLNKTSFLRQSVKNFHICCCTTRNTNKRNGNSSVTLLNQYNRQFSVTTSRNIWTPNIWPFKDPPVPALPPGFTENEVVSSTLPNADSVASVASVSDSVTSTVTADPGVTEVITGAIIDPPFIELGLASSWFPNHLVHQLLEFVHTSTDLQWWSTIIIGTCIIRIVSMPLYIYTRKYSVRYNNHREELGELTEKASAAQLEGGMMQQMVARQKLKDYYKTTGTGPIRGFFVNSSMSVLFITCITALRQMCATPVPSMTEGGALWFTDLTSGDPYYALPILTGAVVGLTLNVALKAGTMQRASAVAGVMKKLQYAPIVAFPLLFGNMSSGVYLYILTTSTITLGMQRLLVEPRVKKMLDFPEFIQSDKKKQTLRQMIREYNNNAKEKTNLKVKLKTIKHERKQRAKDLKKELKGKPPITFTIGVEAMPVKAEKPDFEGEWRPPRPKVFGIY
ncbi:uncharacterized protein LOC120348624 [Styela clava]